MRGRLSALLIASDPHVREMLARAIRSRFSKVHLETATNAAEALQVLQSKHFDIVVCDIYLDYIERISFISDMCTAIQNERQLIVITAATDITEKSFPSSIESKCLRNVIHKPIVMEHLLDEIETALLEVTSRKRDAE